MNILILGATGFIGHAIFHSVTAHHSVLIGGRKPIEGYNNYVKVDFTLPIDWDEILIGIDLVVNAIGIIEGDFELIQKNAPIKLYESCIQKNIRIVHISAIGAEKENPLSDFLQSKKDTDQFLLRYPLAHIIYPGIVIGKNGKSTQFFMELSSLPIIPVFNDNPIPFIHINQLASLIKEVIEHPEKNPKQVFAVSNPEPLKEVFSALKGQKAKFVKIPSSLINALFFIFPKASIGIFNRDSFKLFQQTNYRDYEARFPKVSTIIDPNYLIKGDSFAPLFALLAISFIWIWSGISSIVSWDESYGMMQEIGANHRLSNLFIILGCMADIFLGVAIFIKKIQKKILILSVITMCIYMAILTIWAPHYWLHPFGVLSKNIPLIALTYYLYNKK